jgi:hypothetical protein
VADQPSQAQLEKIADNLSRPIPKPKRPVAKPQSSWRTLKPGQTLQLRSRWFRPGLDLPQGTKVQVRSVDSLGMDLTVDLTHISEESTIHTLRWTDPEWKGMFEKVKKGRKDGQKKEEG